MKKKIFIILLFLLVAAGFSLRAYAGELNIPVKEYTLSNGIKVLIVERHTSPTFSAQILFKTGSADDPVGLTGVAHMLEHMMFKGTKTIGTTNYEAEIPIMKKIDILAEKIEKEKAKGIADPARTSQNKIVSMQKQIAALEKEEEKYAIAYEITSILENAGSTGLNAGTSFDYTNYIVSLPSNKLELWAYLESDRINNPVFRMFTKERSVIAEERRMAVESKPMGKMLEVFLYTMYAENPYHHPVIGWADDIDNFKAKDVMEVFKRNYSPKNMVIAVVGDVNAEKTIRTIKKYFGGLKNYGNIRAIFTQESPQKDQKRAIVSWDAKPNLWIGFHGPKAVSRDRYALNLLNEILGSGKTSRLYKDMVEDKKIAVSVACAAFPLKYETPFLFIINPAKAEYSKTAEEEFFKQIEKIKKEKVSAWELEKAKNKLIAAFIREIEDNADLADKLTYGEGILGSWRYFDLRKEYEEITADDIQKAAKKYLNKDNSTVVELTKPVAAGL